MLIIVYCICIFRINLESTYAGTANKIYNPSPQLIRRKITYTRLMVINILYLSQTDHQTGEKGVVCNWGIVIYIKFSKTFTSLLLHRFRNLLPSHTILLP